MQAGHADGALQRMTERAAPGRTRKRWKPCGRIGCEHKAILAYRQLHAVGCCCGVSHWSGFRPLIHVAPLPMRNHHLVSTAPEIILAQNSHLANGRDTSLRPHTHRPARRSS